MDTNPQEELRRLVDEIHEDSLETVDNLVNGRGTWAEPSTISMKENPRIQDARAGVDEIPGDSARLVHPARCPVPESVTRV